MTCDHSGCSPHTEKLKLLFLEPLDDELDEESSPEENNGDNVYLFNMIKFVIYLRSTVVALLYYCITNISSWFIVLTQHMDQTDWI